MQNMSDSLYSLFKSAEQTLCFEYETGGITVMEYPHTTGWRTMKAGMIAQLNVGMTRLERERGQELLVHGSEAVFVPSGVTHKIDKVSHPPSVSRWAHITCSLFGTIDLFSLLNIPTIFTEKQAQRIGELNEALASLQEQSSLSLSQILEKKALGFSLLAVLTEQATLDEQHLQALASLQHLAPLLQYIEAHLDQPLAREELASWLHISGSHLYALFKESLGTSPSLYIQCLRFQKAQHYLLHSDLSVKEIGARVGYTDVFHFSRHFKKHCGLSPAHYREELCSVPGRSRDITGRL